MLPVYTYSYFVKSLKIKSFKFNCAYRFFIQLQLSFLVNFKSYGVLVHQGFAYIISVEDPEPVLG